MNFYIMHVYIKVYRVNTNYSEDKLKEADDNFNHQIDIHAVALVTFNHRSAKRDD